MKQKIVICLILLSVITIFSFSQDLNVGNIQKTVFLELQNNLLSDGVTVEEKDGKIVIVNAVMFLPENANFREDQKAKLDKIANSLKKYPIIKIEIIGHCASVGNPEGEKELSVKRANSVKQYLVSKKAVAEGNMTIKGSGAEKPLAPNNSETNMAKNRRVEIVFVSFI